MEVFCLTAKKYPKILDIFKWPALVLAILFIGLTGTWLSLGIGAVLVAYVVYWHFWGHVEYETSYFDGEFRFARIYNKSRRKKLKYHTMENVITIAPAGDRSVYRYETDRSVKLLDYSSGEKGAKVYDLIVKDKNTTLLYKVELDDRFLDAVCVKYSQQVVR